MGIEVLCAELPRSRYCNDDSFLRSPHFSLKTSTTQMPQMRFPSLPFAPLLPHDAVIRRTTQSSAARRSHRTTNRRSRSPLSTDTSSSKTFPWGVVKNVSPPSNNLNSKLTIHDSKTPCQIKQHRAAPAASVSKSEFTPVPLFLTSSNMISSALCCGDK